VPRQKVPLPSVEETVYDNINYYYYTGLLLNPLLEKLDKASKGYDSGDITTNNVAALVENVYYEIADILTACAKNFLPERQILVGRRTVCHTSTYGVALVRISDAGLKRAAHGSLQIQDAKKLPKITICAPSHNFVGLYLRN